MKTLSIIMLTATLLVVSVFVSKADTKQDIEKANKKGKVVFLVVTEKGNSQNQAALNLANQAQKSVSKSSVLELDVIQLIPHLFKNIASQALQCL